MKIEELFKQNRPVYSFEIFPPKKTTPIDTIYTTLDELQKLKPDYISVTYGAGGNDVNPLTSKIVVDVKEKYGIEAVAHLTCINYNREQVEKVLDLFKKSKIENILALRGDKNPEIDQKTDFKYASQLVELIKSKGDFDIAGACYPEGHVEADSLEDDIINLKKKVDAGVSHLTSQLFFDNRVFFEFLEKVDKAGIKVPIQAGIMPVTNKKQIERMVTMCGASLPSKFVKMMQKYEASQEALEDAGVAYATEQIVDLLANGVDGIHLYTMNKPRIAEKITNNIKTLIYKA